MSKVDLYIAEGSSVLSPGGRAIAKAGNKMLEEKLNMETIPLNYLDWVDCSGDDCLKHDLVLTTKSGKRYNMGSLYKDTRRHILEQKKKTESWHIMPSVFKHSVDDLGKHRSLKGAKEKLMNYVKDFLEQVQET